MTERAMPSTQAMIWTLAGVTLKRLGRGKALWIGALLAALPTIYAGGLRPRRFAFSADDLFAFSLLLFAVLPAMFVGASVGEEIEDRTATYLWSRPIARPAVLAGKLVALVPIVIALSVGGWFAGIEIATGAPPTLASCLALAAGGIASSLIVASIAVLVPKHGMALSIGYMLVDLFIGALPFTLQNLSVTYHTHNLAGFSAESAIATPLIGMLVVAGIWAAIGARRIGRLEV